MGTVLLRLRRSSGICPLEELAQDAGREDILNRHPSLAPEDIQAALAYASEPARDAIIPASAYPGARFLRHFCT